MTHAGAVNENSGVHVRGHQLEKLTEAHAFRIADMKSTNAKAGVFADISSKSGYTEFGCLGKGVDALDEQLDA